MIDKRSPLPGGTILVGKNGIRYTLAEGSVGRGGSALVYPALREGSGRLFVIKECYPLSDRCEFVRRNWVVCPKGEDDGAEYLELLKAGFSRENEIGQAIANRTGRVIAAWETLDVREIIVGGTSFSPGDGAFLVMEQAEGALGQRGWFLRDLLDECARSKQDGRPLRCGGLPEPYVVVRIMEELLKALRDVHRAGYLHGDVQEGNLFFMGPAPETGDIGVGQLLDFGTARPLGSDGLTLPVTDRRVFSTPGYRPPEILTGNDGTLRLSPAADVYSAGCLMLYLIKGMSFKEAWGEDVALAGGLTRRGAERRGFREEAAGLAIELLDKALSSHPGDRYRDADEMLRDILTLKNLVHPPRFQLPANLTRSPSFVEGSREKELARLKDELAAGKHPLWIWGIWGIGKTELAMEFARRQQSRGMAAFLVSFRGTMKETIRSLAFSGYRFSHNGREDPAEQEYREKLDILKESYVGALLIIDGFDGEDLPRLRQEKAYRDVVGLDLHLLFTTRSRPDRVTPELQPLKEEDALALYRSITEMREEDREDVIALLRAVRCHPLAVELSAHAVENDWGEGNISPKRLAAKFRSGTLNKQDDATGIYGHIRSLFTMYRPDESCREVLCHTTLLPQGGMDAALFLSGEDRGQKAQVKRLEEHGWIRRGKGNLLRIHPLVKTVFQQELNPSDKDCDGFLSSLWSWAQLQYPPDETQFRQLADVFAGAADRLENAGGNYSFCAGYCSFAVGQTPRAFLCANDTIRIREASLPSDDPALAQAYNAAGAVALAYSQWEEALTYFGKALSILERQPVCAELGEIYANLSAVRSELGEHQTAVDCGKKALDIFASAPPRNKAHLICAHSALGTALAMVREYGEAISHVDAAIALGEGLMPGDHPELAALYCAAGNVYGLAGRFSDALELLKKAVSIQEKILPWDHRDIIGSYLTLAEVHTLLGDEETAAHYKTKAAEAQASGNRAVWAKILKSSMQILALSEHTMSKESLAQRYRSVAEAHRQLRNYGQAEEYIGKAIRTLLAGTEDPMQQVLNYATASDIRYDQVDYENALFYAKRALAVMTEYYPEDWDNLSVYAMKVGTVFRRRKELEKALACYQDVVRFQANRPRPDPGMLHIAQSAVGNIQAELGRYEEAKASLGEVLRSRSASLPEFHADVRETKAFLENVERLREERESGK